MAKIILDYPDDLPPSTAVSLLQVVVDLGKVSEGGGVKHFCWVSVFKNGFTLHTRRKKKNQTTDSFWISKGP